MMKRFLTRLFYEIFSDSTFVGNTWFPIFLLYRILLIAFGIKPIFDNNKNEFSCLTNDPECLYACYTVFAPIPHILFWVFQVILLMSPTFTYLVYAWHKTAEMEDDYYQVDNSEDDLVILVNFEKRQLKRDSVLKAYLFQLLFRTIIEASFIFAQYMLYRHEFTPFYVCTFGPPCPHDVKCLASNHNEKTLCLLVMFAVSALSLLFTAVELIYLSVRGLQKRIHAPQPYLGAAPGYHTALEKDPVGKLGFRDNLGDSARETFAHEASTPKHPKLLWQALNEAYENQESTPERNDTVVDQHDFFQEMLSGKENCAEMFPQGSALIKLDVSGRSAQFSRQE